jgi:hypothetical protein
MGSVISLLFKPPPIPQIELPLPARVLPGVKATISQAFELAYYRGVYDGLVAGVLITLLFVPSIRSRVMKGAANVIDHF